MSEFKKYYTKDRQKQKNLSDILRFVVEKQETTRREIERETGFSWGTVSQNVAQLLEDGYLKEENQSDKNVGRNTSVLKLNGAHVAAIGMDVNLSGITVQIVGFDLSQIYEVKVPFEADSQQELLELIRKLCHDAITYCADRYRILSIGIAFQGNVDVKNGISIRFPQFPEWEPVKVKELFEEEFGIFTYLEHDPKCLLFAKSISHKINDGILLRVDNGIGLSVIQDGKILNDSGRMELGHTIAVPDGEVCTCGRKGCLEAYSSIRGIVRRLHTPYDKLLIYAQDSQEIAAAFAEAAEYLAVALYNVCMLFAPQRIILTGKLIQEQELFTNHLIEAFRKLDGTEEIEMEVDLHISASFGVAVQSIKEAIKNNSI